MCVIGNTDALKTRIFGAPFPHVEVTAKFGFGDKKHVLYWKVLYLYTSWRNLG